MAIEHLRQGDLVVTRDNGTQPVIWIASRWLGPADLEANPKLRPISIAPELLGATARLLVSPQHGVVIGRPDGDEFLVRAKHLERLSGGQARVATGRRHVTYIHLMFEAHQIIFANGAATESFYPGPQALASLGSGPLNELTCLWPQLFDQKSLTAYGRTARSFVPFAELPTRQRDLRNSQANMR